MSPTQSASPVAANSEIMQLQEQVQHLLSEGARADATEARLRDCRAENAELSLEVTRLRKDIASLEERYRAQVKRAAANADRAELADTRQERVAALAEQLKEQQKRTESERKRADDLARDLQQRKQAYDWRREQVLKSEDKARKAEAEAAGLQAEVLSLQAQLARAIEGRVLVIQEGNGAESEHVASLEARMVDLEKKLHHEQERSRADADARRLVEESLRTVLEQFQDASARASNETQRADRLARTLAEQQARPEDREEELECWRWQRTSAPITTQSVGSLIPVVQDALRWLVPRMRSVVVTCVERVVNIGLWKRYSLTLQTMAGKLQSRSEVPRASEICPSLTKLQGALSHITLDAAVNEVLLIHGTDSAEDIIKQGFDDRMCHRALYGSGIYLTIDFCKAAHHGSNSSCVVIARAALGHPYLAEGKMPRERRPRPVSRLDNTPHDSTIVQPGIPNGKGGNGKGGQRTQVHWEFVVPDEQLYPEFVVHFRYD